MLYFLSWLALSIGSITTAIQLTLVDPVAGLINKTDQEITLHGEGLQDITVEFEDITGTTPKQTASPIPSKASFSQASFLLPVYTEPSYVIIRVKNDSMKATILLFHFYEEPSFSCCDPPNVSFTGSDTATITGKNFFPSNSILVRLLSSWTDKTVSGKYVNQTTIIFNAPITSYSQTYTSKDYSINVFLAMDGRNYFPMSGTSSFAYYERELLQLAFIYVGPINDFGWSYSQNQGRKEIEMLYPGLITTEYREKVRTEEAKNLLLEYCQNGFDMIFTGSFEYYNISREVADSPKCRDTHIVSATGIMPSEKMSTMLARIYEAKYLAGMTAGYKLAQEKSIGNCVAYLGGEEIPEVFRGFNSFALGCKYAFPNCIVKVIFLDTWENATLEAAAAEYMWHVGKCRIIAQETDSTKPSELYNSLDGYSIGYNSDMSSVVGESVLVSPYIVWGKLYQYFIDKLIKGGSFPGEDYFRGMSHNPEDPPVNLWPFSNSVDEMTRIQVNDRWRQIRGVDQGKGVFCGSLRKGRKEGFANVSSDEYEDNNSNLCLTEIALKGMMYTLENVELMKANVDTNWGTVRYSSKELPIYEIIEIDWEIPVELLVLFLLISSLGLLTVFFTALYMWKFRNNKWFKSHSVRLMWFILLGCFLLFILPIIIALPRTPEYCILTRFLTHLAFFICALPICLKTYRLNKFFAAARHLQTAKCTDKQLIFINALCLIVFSVYCAVWFSSQESFTKREFLAKENKYLNSCSDHNIYDYIIFIAEVLSILWALQLVVMIRGIPKQFNESKYIAFTLYTVLVIGIILLPIVLAIQNQPDLKYFLENFGILVVAWALYFALFGVKVQKIIKGEQLATRSKLRNQDSRHGITLKRSPGSQGSSLHTQHNSLSINQDKDGISSLGTASSLAIKAPS